MDIMRRYNCVMLVETGQVVPLISNLVCLWRLVMMTDDIYGTARAKATEAKTTLFVSAANSNICSMLYSPSLLFPNIASTQDSDTVISALPELPYPSVLTIWYAAALSGL
jgi:hypothetical protein